MTLWKLTVLLTFVSVAGCASHVPPRAAPDNAATSSSEAWNLFWQSRHVSPPPPRGFLEWTEPLPEILNLTGGAIDDETVHRWVTADLRREEGDGWASCSLRRDVADADVLGPPGLNGTVDQILAERSKGAVEGGCAQLVVTETAAVVGVPKDVQKRIPAAELTDFVIVLVRRTTGLGRERVFADGHRERIPPYLPSGSLEWQLDTGGYRDDPVVGPLWYQARGWSCRIDGSTKLDEICRLVLPWEMRPASVTPSHAPSGTGVTPAAAFRL